MYLFKLENEVTMVENGAKVLKKSCIPFLKPDYLIIP